MSQIQADAADFVESHPKFLGVLFTMLVLLTQAGSAAAAAAASNAGP